MRATWRPLPTWPHPPKPKRADLFKATWDQTLAKLESEIEALRGHDALIGVVADENQFTMAGIPRSTFRVRHPGAEVSFDTKRGRLVFHTDAYDVLQSNLRAIALGLEALRAVDRYGITSSAEQYAGFAQLSAGGPDPSRGKALVEAAGGMRQALMRHHPDQGGNERDFVDVDAYRKQIGA